MDDMNAKQLFSKSVTEADAVPPEHSPGVPPAGRQYPPMPQRRQVPPLRRRPGAAEGGGGAPGMDDPEMMGAKGGDPVGRMVGREQAPKGQFNPKELSQLKDVVIMILASLARSDLDMQIGQALASGQELSPSQLQHILDEARNAPIPESHGPLMQKIFSKLSQQR